MLEHWVKGVPKAADDVLTPDTIPQGTVEVAGKN
jgi:hypothetical protein